jgi:hypothetical protein
MPRYKVYVDDNFHVQEPDATWEGGVYDTAEEALAFCRGLVDQFLKESYKSGMPAESLFDNYTSWGDDPSIVVIGGVDAAAQFSAWEYAKQRCREICGDTPSVGP